MPMPVSRTWMTAESWSAAVATSTSPRSGVNLTAFDSRLMHQPGLVLEQVVLPGELLGCRVLPGHPGIAEHGRDPDQPGAHRQHHEKLADNRRPHPHGATLCYLSVTPRNRPAAPKGWAWAGAIWSQAWLLG